MHMKEYNKITPEEDGTTHINIYSKGKTELGRDLSNFAHTPFCHQDHGLFASVEGYWYWLTRQDDSLRHLYGFKAKEAGRSLPAIKQWHPEQFKAFVCAALDAKLAKNLHIKQELIESTLPLEHYYAKYYGETLKVTVPGNSLWLLAHFEGIRQAHNPQADMKNTLKIETLRLKLEGVKAEPEQPSLF